MTRSSPKKASPSLAGSPAFHPRAPISRVRDPRGDRYNHSQAFDPRTGLSTPRSRKDDVTVAAVADPHEPGKRLLANVNRRVDLLEDERSHGRISVSQYEVGRQVQAVFEKASGARSGSGVWGVMAGREVPRDTHGLSSQEVQAIRAITDARELKVLARRIERAVGPYGVQMLRSLLCTAGSFKDHALARNALAGERECAQLATRFRYLLEALDETLSATGLVQFDAEGNPVIRAERGELTGEETDARGRLVPAGHGYRWGRPED